jgi:hypothetical protein
MVIAMIVATIVSAGSPVMAAVGPVGVAIVAAMVTTTVMAPVVVTAMITAVVATLMATILVAMLAGDLAGDLLRQFRAGVTRERRGAGQQRSQENEGHWAFHLDLLSGSYSIRCGASIEPGS